MAHRRQLFSGLALLLGKQSSAEVAHNVLWERLIEGAYLMMAQEPLQFAQHFGEGSADQESKQAVARFLRWVGAASK